MRVVKKKEKGSTLSLYHRVKLIGKDGKVKYSSDEKKSDSFVKNFMAALMNLLSDGHITTSIYTDHDGTTRSGASKTTWEYAGYPFILNAPSNNDDYGIRIGTGDTAVTALDIDLDTLIETGGGVGQLSYGAQSWVAAQESGVNIEWSLLRTFTNSSGSEIIVAEIGMSMRTVSDYCLIARDVLAAAVGVGDGEAFVVEYIWRTAV